MSRISWEDMSQISIKRKSDAIKYKGKRIAYLCESDIDKTGRGYYWVRYMAVGEIHGNQFICSHSADSISYKSIVRIFIYES